LKTSQSTVERGHADYLAKRFLMAVFAKSGHSAGQRLSPFAISTAITINAKATTIQF
jgi:hypothetical protein